MLEIGELLEARCHPLESDGSWAASKQRHLREIVSGAGHKVLQHVIAHDHPITPLGCDSIHSRTGVVAGCMRLSSRLHESKRIQRRIGEELSQSSIREFIASKAVQYELTEMLERGWLACDVAYAREAKCEER